ncbi:cyclic nucleotide-binding domain-containing protein [Thermodesulfobacteriota bacterium]
MKNGKRKISRLIVEAVGKLSLFKELTDTQVLDLLSVCSVRIFKVDEIVCGVGMDSTEMFLLFSGELSVCTESGIPIASLTPVTTVGEMGIITGQPRTATVLAKQDSETFVINKRQFEELVKKNENMGVKIYKNVANSLCDKILNDNIRIRDYFEREDIFQKKFKILKSLLQTRASMSDDEIEAEIG